MPGLHMNAAFGECLTWFWVSRHFQEEFLFKMAVLLLLVLLVQLTAGVSGDEAQEPFSKLTDSYKKGVELALHQVNGHHRVQQHFLFLKTLHQAEIQAGFDVTYIYHNFYLKATKCRRGTENADASTCAFRNDRPLIDCVICYKISAGEIDGKPYLSCMYRRALSKESKREREVGCYQAGFGSLTPTPVPITGS